MMPPRVVLATALLFGFGRAAQSQADPRFEGDYAFAVDGSVIMAVHLTQGAGGVLSGSVSAGGKTLPVSGSVRDGHATFVTGIGDGGYLHWDARPVEQGGLSVTLVPTGVDGKPDQSLAQQHVLTRRSPGMTAGLSQAAQQWIVRLSAVADSITVWCASPSFRETDVCAKAMQILKRVAPALMVARFTTGGQATSLLRVLSGSSGGVTPAGTTAPASNAELFSAIQPPSPDAVPPSVSTTAPVGPPAPAAAGQSSATRGLATNLTGGGSSTSLFSGEWAIYADGTELVTLRFDTPVSAAGANGTISIVGDAKPFAGTLSANALEFPFSAADGTPTQWRVVPRGGQLAATISGPNGTQEQLLERRTGWSESAPLAQQWHRSLEGRSLTRTTRTNGGTSGGATTEFVMSFCSGSTLLTETRSVVSVNVPGAGGSQTSRQAGRGTWRTVSRGDVAAIVMTSDEGTMQLGVRRGDGNTMYVVQELVRLGAAQCQ